MSKLSSFLFLECATSYVVHRATSMWSSLMTMNGMETVIIYSLETIYQTLINLKASFQGNEVIDNIKSSILLLSITTIYSRTSRKPPPKMQRLNGHLREMVAYKNLTTGVSSFCGETTSGVSGVKISPLFHYFLAIKYKNPTTSC